MDSKHAADASEGLAVGAERDRNTCPVDVVVPTRNRPGKLQRCLRALADARQTHPFRVFVVDSSTSSAMRDAVEEICESFSFVSLRRHDRAGLAAARNECTLAGTAPLLVSVDDDVYVASTAVDRLLQRYAREDGWRVVAGKVFWGDAGSGGVRMRRIGYGTREMDETRVDFYVTALILYPRVLAAQFRFNDRTASSEDRFMGALWRSKQVRLLWEPTAEAWHDDEHNTGWQTAKHHEAHIYTNLFDAILVRRSLTWALAFEFLGFAAGAKLHCRQPKSAATYCRAWVKGNILFVRDWRRLRTLTNIPLTGVPPEASAKCCTEVCVGGDADQTTLGRVERDG